MIDGVIRARGIVCIKAFTPFVVCFIQSEKNTNFGCKKAFNALKGQLEANRIHGIKTITTISCYRKNVQPN